MTSSFPLKDLVNKLNPKSHVSSVLYLISDLGILRGGETLYWLRTKNNAKSTSGGL
jgi:hypothetical protein